MVNENVKERERERERSIVCLGIVIQCQQKILEKPNEEFKGSAQLARSIYILGVLCKYFDIEKSEFDELEVNYLDQHFSFNSSSSLVFCR